MSIFELTEFIVSSEGGAFTRGPVTMKPSFPTSLEASHSAPCTQPGDSEKDKKGVASTS